MRRADPKAMQRLAARCRCAPAYAYRADDENRNRRLELRFSKFSMRSSICVPEGGPILVES